MKEGDVVICDTGQAGTLILSFGSESQVLLRNGDVWVGDIKRLRLPQGAPDLEACPIDVERPESKAKKRDPYEVT